jgi:hypothetical protein
MPTDLNRQMYSEAHKECVAVIRSSTENYDKNLITISSAFLAIPIALVRQVSATKPLVGSPIFYVASVCFVATILFVLISYQMGSKVQRCRMNDLKEYYLDEKDEAFNRKSSWSRWLAIVNTMSGLCFLSAVIFTVIFVHMNLGKFQ